MVSGKCSPLLVRPSREPDHSFPSHAATRSKVMYFDHSKCYVVTKSKIKSWTERVVRTWERRGACRVLVGKREGKRPLGRPGRRREDNINPLTPNDLYMCRTAPLTSKSCILYIYSTNVGTGYFKHALYPPFFSLQNAVCFIMLTCLVPVLFTFYIQAVLKLKKKIIIPAPKG